MVSTGAGLRGLSYEQSRASAPCVWARPTARELARSMENRSPSVGTRPCKPGGNGQAALERGRRDAAAPFAEQPVCTAALVTGRVGDHGRGVTGSSTPPDNLNDDDEEVAPGT